MLKMYQELANWWHLLSPVSEYEEEASFYAKTMIGAGLPENRSLLELGSGGGNNAFYLKQHFSQVTLSDLSPHMLAMSEQVNPNCEHAQGDMRTLRLNKQFNAIFVHDAIDYMTTEDDLRAALETGFVHCRPGGVALIVPDYTAESFEPSTEHGGAEGRDEHGREMRYLEWTTDPDPADTTYLTDYIYILREGNNPPTVEHEQHIGGLFPLATWVRLIKETGFEPEIIKDLYNRDIFLARRQDM